MTPQCRWGIALLDYINPQVGSQERLLKNPQEPGRYRIPMSKLILEKSPSLFVEVYTPSLFLFLKHLRIVLGDK